MRKFYLEADSTRIPLNGENGILFTSPEGLGFSFADTYSGISDGFFRRTNSKHKQGSITGTITIFGNAYSDYESFVNQILTASHLTIVYDPCGTEYKADVNLSLLTKTESVVGLRISFPVSFTLLSLWYTEETLTGTGSVSVSAGGHMGASIVLTAQGALTDPVIELKEGGQAFATIEINKTFTAADTIEFSNRPEDSHIRGVIDGTTVDLLRFVSTSFTEYHRNNGGAFTVNLAGASLSVAVRKYWRTV